MIYTNNFESIQEAINYIGAKSPNVAYVTGCLNPNCLVYTDVGEDVDIIFQNNNGFIIGHEQIN